MEDHILHEQMNKKKKKTWRKRKTTMCIIEICGT